jgi:hypothetical protein
VGGELVTADHSAVLAACVAGGRCVLCGRLDCPYNAAALAGREPVVDGTEDCASFYRSCVSFDRLAEVVAA